MYEVMGFVDFVGFSEHFMRYKSSAPVEGLLIGLSVGIFGVLKLLMVSSELLIDL